MNISFWHTQDQIRARTKTVTRRLGWADAKPGQILDAIEKGQGLPKGGHVIHMCKIRVLSNRPEPVNAVRKYPPGETAKEGFPEMTPDQFIKFFCGFNQISPLKMINRIEFEYL